MIVVKQQMIAVKQQMIAVQHQAVLVYSIIQSSQYVITVLSYETRRRGKDGGAVAVAAFVNRCPGENCYVGCCDFHVTDAGPIYSL